MAAARQHHSPPPSQPNGASCVIWYRDPETRAIMVLAGVESRYVRDRHGSPKTEAERTKLEALKTLERFLPAKTEAEQFRKDAVAFKRAAKAKFTKRVHEITAAEIGAIKSKSASADTSHVRIQFDTPIRIDDGDSSIYEVRFRELKFDESERQQPKLGIIKGGREDGDGTLADTVVREVAEEVGMNLNKSRLTNMEDAEGYACFSFQIEPKDVPVWTEVIRQRSARNYGELFHLGFLPLRAIIGRGANVMDAFERLPEGLVLPPGHELRINRKTISALQVFLRWINPYSSQASSGKGAPGGKGAPDDKGAPGGKGGGLRKRRESRRRRRRHHGLRSSRKR